VFFFLLICNFCELNEKFISGDQFRNLAQHVYDERSQEFFPEKVQKNDIVFVCSDKKQFLSYFFDELHPRIKHPYILITHNSDDEILDGDEEILDDSKILAWFSQNVLGAKHKKLFGVPIGIANKKWPHGDTTLLYKMLEQKDHFERRVLCYLNFRLHTHPLRRPLARKFRRKPWCLTRRRRYQKDYLLDLLSSKFVLSPRGNGADCHRTWEALLMGAIPIILSSEMDSLYEDLPVLIVNDWDEVTESFLKYKYDEIRSRAHNIKKLFFPYWKNLIECQKIK